jgi:hypothetical protein
MCASIAGALMAAILLASGSSNRVAAAGNMKSAPD